MIVCFVDIGGIVDHHRLNFLFIINMRKSKKKNQFPEKNSIG
jgi:hypothetical protein